MAHRENCGGGRSCIIILAMNTYYKTPLVWVDTNQKLMDMIYDLKNHQSIGVDTESDSLYVYKEKVCLIQISTTDKDYLVDPLKIQDLSPLNEIFKDDQIEKIFHAAEYDLICLKRDYDFEVNHIFDTMIASRILGKKAIGLSALLETYFQVNVNKKYQRANWGIRPLSEEMLDYARQDSHYLIQLRDILDKELTDKNKREIAKEDFVRMSLVQHTNGLKNDDHVWKILKGNHISPHQTALLFDLYNYRESLAEKLNRPPFKVFGNQVILKLIEEEPGTLDDLKNIRGLSPKIINKNGKDILNIIKLAKTKKPVYKKFKPKPSPTFLLYYDNLKKWRKKTGDRLNVESDIILPKDIIEMISQTQPKTLDDLAKVMREVPYRFSQFGEEILEVLNPRRNNESSL